MDRKQNKSGQLRKVPVISLFFSFSFSFSFSSLALLSILLDPSQPIELHLDGMTFVSRSECVLRFELDWELEQLACTNQTGTMNRVLIRCLSK